MGHCSGHGRARAGADGTGVGGRSEEHTSELQSLTNIVCRLLLEKKKNINQQILAAVEKEITTTDTPPRTAHAATRTLSTQKELDAREAAKRESAFISKIQSQLAL